MDSRNHWETDVPMILLTINRYTVIEGPNFKTFNPPTVAERTQGEKTLSSFSDEGPNVIELIETQKEEQDSQMQHTPTWLDNVDDSRPCSLATAFSNKRKCDKRAQGTY